MALLQVAYTVWLAYLVWLCFSVWVGHKSNEDLRLSKKLWVRAWKTVSHTLLALSFVLLVLLILNAIWGFTS